MTDKKDVKARTGRVSKAVSDALAKVEKSGNVVTQVCNVVKAAYKGDAVPNSELSAIADDVAVKRAWTTASADARKSEVRKIVRAYVELPEAIKRYKAQCKDDRFTWHTAVRLARCVGQTSTIPQACNMMLGKAKASAAAKATPAAVVKQCLARINNVQTRAAKMIAFRKELNTLYAKHFG